MTAPGTASRFVARARRALGVLEARTRPLNADTEAALARRWEELPAAVRTPSQLLGQRSSGCEGTHGVFPRCNFACSPCYLGSEANQVRTDAAHTVAEIDAQMSYLRDVRGADQHAQLIGGEVTLLGPEAHAEALETMMAHQRKPMSMSHGDFDYDYLKRLAINPDGTRRFDFLRFAGHFDSLMRGRRDINRPRHEADLHPFRARFVGHFERLEREHGVAFDLAHNMTVTPANIDQVSEVVRGCLDLRFGMMSFQPAAYVGNPRRWSGDFHAVSMDSVWAEIEAAVGTRIPYEHVQMGDPRCNRSCHGLIAQRHWVPILDDRDPRDLAVRDRFLATFRSFDFERPPLTLAIALARVLVRDPLALRGAPGWAWRLARRLGWRRLLFGHPRALTFVVHAFMDAKVVTPAWELMERGERAEDPEIRAAQERLAACSYAMAHPDQDRLVPACVQHAVLDASENVRLRELLPISHTRA